MKVKYIKYYEDEFGDKYEVGWVAEHAQPEAEKRIALGVCETVGSDTKALKYKVGQKLLVDECAADPIFETPEAPSSPKKVASNPLVITKK